MRAVVQRTSSASVTIEGEVIAAVGDGLTVLLGVGTNDSEADAKYLADKMVNLRIFADEAGKMNLSLLDISGELLVVSQFTLYADCRKGRRPGFDNAAPPQLAEQLYEKFIFFCREYGIKTANGRFQSEMTVKIENQGPVTILLDSSRLF